MVPGAAFKIKIYVYSQTQVPVPVQWGNCGGSLTHHVALRLFARAFRRRMDVHDGVVRRGGRRLPCACSRGRFGDAWMSMTVSFGAEAEEAARASAGNCSMLNQT
eukprot:scaffold8542_cov119-Isochrysis_galbana.AAC.6